MLPRSALSAILTGREFADVRAELTRGLHVSSVLAVEKGIGHFSSSAVIVADKDGSSGRALIGTVPDGLSLSAVKRGLEVKSDGGAMGISFADIERMASWLPPRAAAGAPACECVPLSEVAEIRPGVHIPRDSLFPVDSPTGIPYIRASDISSDRIDPSGSQRAPGAYIGKAAAEGDILLNSRSKTYSCALVGEGDAPCIPSSMLAVLRVRSEGFLPEYVALYLRSGMFHDQAESRKTGVTMPSLSISSLKEIPVPAIPIPDQRSLVCRCGADAERDAIDEALDKIIGNI